MYLSPTCYRAGTITDKNMYKNEHLIHVHKKSTH